MSASRKGPGGRRKRIGNQYVTKSGNSFKIHRNLTERWVARRDATEARRAERKAGLPKSRIKRFFYHFAPGRMYRYWFSRDGGIMALKIVGLGFIVGFVTLLAVFAYFRKDLPNLTASGNNIGGSIRYYDRTGKTLLWEDYDAVKRVPVKTSEMAPYIRKATVAVEDKDFYKHGGFDVRGILRAGINDTFGHGGTQGGSTITQQLVKLSEDWTGNRTVTRKIKEVILAVELERSYSKDDILTGYLNTAPYGNIEYGVEAASRDYFQKSAKDLTLDEAAFMAAIPKSPSVYSPYGPYYEKKELLARQRYILDLMVNQGMITQEQATAAKKVNILKKIHKQEPKYAGIKAPYFVLAAKAELDDQYIGTNTRAGWKVITSLDLKLQDLAETVIKNDLPNIQAHNADEAAFVAEDVKTGQIVSLVGGTDFTNPDHGKINYAHDAFIPPGSSFKPYDYSSLIETSNNVGAGSVLYDKVGPLPGYPCTHGSDCLTDFDKRSPGPETLRYALGGSRNIPAVKANLIVGTDKVIKIASDMMDNVGDQRSGLNSYNCYSDVALTKTTQCYGASAIGDGAFLHLDDHVNGLATLARLGKAIPRTYITRIIDSNNKDVPLVKHDSKQVIRPDTAYIMDDMASDPNASYFPYGTKFQRYNGWHFAVKTGTTNNGFDGLMTSWSTQYAAVSWVGYHTRNKALFGPMENLTMPITRNWMEAAHNMLHKSPINWQKPAGVKTMPAFVIRSHVGYGSVEPSPANDLYPSWYVPNSKQAKASKPIDIVSNKLATDCTPSLARKSASNSNANIFSVDIFVDKGGSTANTSQTDDVHHCDDERPHISITSPSGGDCSNPCTITVSVAPGTHPLYDPKYAALSGSGTVRLIVGGVGVQSKRVASTVSFSYTGSGTKTVSVQVIDSVLYDATSGGISVNFTGASSPLAFISAKKDTNDNTKINVEWSGGLAPFTLTDNFSPSWSKTCSSSCQVSIANAPINSMITIEDSNSNSVFGTVKN